MVGLFQVLLVLFAFASVPLYVLVLLFLVKHRGVDPFSKHFYHLFISLGLSDLCGAVHAYVVQLFRIWGWLDYTPLFYHQTFGWFFRMSIDTGSFFFGWISYLGVLAIAANRYYSIASPGKWTGSIQRAVVAVQWTVPFLIVAPRFLTEYRVRVRNDTTVVYLATRIDSPYATHYDVIVGVLATTVVNIVVGVFYSRIYLHVRTLKDDFGLSNSDKSEIRLAAVGFCIFILMISIEMSILLDAIFSELFQNEILEQIFMKLIHVSLVLFYLLNPWVLLMCSKVTRLHFSQWLFCVSSIAPVHTFRLHPTAA